ncbi:MAG: 2TM domain-containing protein [Polaribacter sp.]|jgi:hypothetical protein
MDNKFIQEQNYTRAKKRVKAIKGFYIHGIVYVYINIFLSGIIIFGLMQNNYSIKNALSNFGVYSTWIFWGIGLFFHWMGVFGFKFLGFGQDWEERKIQAYLEKEEEKRRF